MPETSGGPALTLTSTAADGTAAGTTLGAPTSQAAGRMVLLAALAKNVLAVPGVVRLEPTLSIAGPGLLLHRNPTDGIRLLTRAGSVQVDINIATRADCQARTVAHQIQASITSVLLAYGYPNCSITVSVLTIEPATVV